MKPTGPVFDASWRAACEVRVASKAEADAAIRAHYLGKWPGVVVLRLGLFRDGTLLGAVVYALPPRETNRRYGGETWELARLWLDDSVPQNGETYLIAQSVRHIRRFRPEVEVLVSYADPSAGHAGTIYRAANWTPDGRTDEGRKTPRFDYACADTGKRYSRRKHVPEHVTIARVPRVSKSRYMLRLKKLHGGLATPRCIV